MYSLGGVVVARPPSPEETAEWADAVCDFVQPTFWEVMSG